MYKGKTTYIPSGETTLIDIYEAAGGEVNEDRTQVSMNPAQMKPFDIKLRVYPSAVTHDMDGERITFGILLDDEMTLEETAGGTLMHRHDFIAELEMPIAQVKILKEDK